jgi:hypothetical protein
MNIRVAIAVLAGVLPGLAGAQESSSTTASPPAPIQAQGNASAGGSASVQRSGNAIESQASGSGAASGSVSKGDKSVNADSATTMNAVLTQSVDARKAKPGDPVAAKTTEPSKTEHGNLPKGTKLLGHVTEAKAAGSGETQSMLGFTFDRAVLKDGHEVPIRSTVNAIAASEGAANVGSEPMSAPMPAAPAGRSGGGGLLGGGASAVGGLSGSASGALGGAGRVAGGVAGSATSSVGAGAQSLRGGAGAIGGLDARGMLSSESQGVFGLRDLSITHSAAGDGSAVLTSSGRTVHLDSGTRMLLSVQSSAERASEGSAPASSASSSSATQKKNPGDTAHN